MCMCSQLLSSDDESARVPSGPRGAGHQRASQRPHHTSEGIGSTRHLRVRVRLDSLVEIDYEHCTFRMPNIHLTTCQHLHQVLRVFHHTRTETECLPTDRSHPTQLCSDLLRFWFRVAFERAFSLLNGNNDKSRRRRCQKIIIFVTDGIHWSVITNQSNH